MSFNTVLIANRGEIACRVIRTARRMGLRTVAVYSDADRDASHVAMADEAHAIGPAPARDSYLRADRIIAAAQRAGAQAVHPGYGFLSENAEFADACTAAGLVFVGPPAAAIRAMGSKSAAKALMQRAGVPLVPGYHGTAQDPGHLAAEAARIGFPVLIKASAGGGGKGMRIVQQPDGFAEALELARSEAEAAFGDSQVLIERYLTRPRHIEVQVFADTHGHVAALFERDCSIQRRHQKVVEEAPAPGMDPARRAAMSRAACDAARAIDYTGAGTVEFIVEAGQFYFMEMNTRLQVEHPVTEMITGQDLVEWQFRVAAGERLPLLQDQLAISGHAIEARLYAEDPERDFAPSTGRLSHLRQPAAADGLRIDTGVREGDEVGIHYDPLLAKLIAWGPNRREAAARLAAALAQYEVVGVRTNLDLLRAIAAHPAFAAAALDTGFIPDHPELLAPRTAAVPPAAVAAIVAEILAQEAAAAQAEDAWSPWSISTGWRLNGASSRELTLRFGQTEHSVRVVPASDGCFQMQLGAEAFTICRDAGGLLRVDGLTRRVAVAAGLEGFTAILDGVNWSATPLDPLAPPATEAVGSDRLLAPMPGLVTAVTARPGDPVRRGDVMLVLEAMKVQMRLLAPRDGVVEAVRAQVGDQVQDGAELVRFAPP